VTTKPCPVVISHPGCDVQPMRCGTCTERDDATEKCHTGVGSLVDPEYVSPSFGCIDWRCRKCGGEVKRD
jgi:hypothetical protein